MFLEEWWNVIPLILEIAKAHDDVHLTRETTRSNPHTPCAI